MSDIYPNKPHVLTPGQKPLKLTENCYFPQLSTLVFHAETFLKSSAQSVWLLHKRRAETGEIGTPKLLVLLLEFGSTSHFQGHDQIPAVFVGRRPPKRMGDSC